MSLFSVKEKTELEPQIGRSNQLQKPVTQSTLMHRKCNPYLLGSTALLHRDIQISIFGRICFSKKSTNIQAHILLLIYSKGIIIK